jgi:crotonobetainyl-CoA:carnitine CoA-transferase CaiB-like acyl-CoA transferase
MSKPFAGLRVVDFTQVISGPFTTFQLASLGADVVKIEQPGGDQGRIMLAPTDQSRDAKMSALFSSVNAGKRSMTLNLKADGARAVIEKLVADADVVVENFKAGTMDKLGYGYEVMRAIKPDIVYCAISGFGQTGPRAGAAAYDPIVQAASGMMSVTGHPETGPTKVGFWVCDMSTGMNAAFAIAGALFKRNATGEGSCIDVSMLDTATSLMSPLLNLYMNFGVEPPLAGNGTPGTGGASTVYETQEGSVTVAAATTGQFLAMANELGLPAVATDARFQTREGRVEHSKDYRALVSPAFMHDTASNWQVRLAAIGVPASKNLSVAEVVVDAQVKPRGTMQPLDTPVGLEGAFAGVNLGFKIAKGGPEIPCPPPALGQHTNDILGELGYSAQAIADLRAAGVL